MDDFKNSSTNENIWTAESLYAIRWRRFGILLTEKSGNDEGD